MNTIKNIRFFLNGKKTYFVAAVTVLYALVYYGFGQHDWATAVNLALGASGLGALRHGIAKAPITK